MPGEMEPVKLGSLLSFISRSICKPLKRPHVSQTALLLSQARLSLILIRSLTEWKAYAKGVRAGQAGRVVAARTLVKNMLLYNSVQKLSGRLIINLKTMVAAPFTPTRSNFRLVAQDHVGYQFGKLICVALTTLRERCAKS
jgi:hypothetical protein